MGSLCATEIFNDAGLMLVAIESVDLQQSKTDTGCRVYGNIEPIAVIVCKADGVYALDMQASLTAIEQLLEDVPGLGAMIAPFNKA